MTQPSRLLEPGLFPALPIGRSQLTMQYMVERYRKQKGKKQLLGSHQKCWIWGRNVVTETLQADRWPILKLCLADSLPEADLAAAEQRAIERNIPLIIESTETLTQKCHSREHQGYLAKMPPYPYATVDKILSNRPPSPLYAVLDSLQDPFNFGAIIRSANVFGVDAIFVAEKNQVEVTSLVARTSAGAVNHIAIVQVENLVELAQQLRDLGIAMMGTTQTSDTRIFEGDFIQPTAVVIGNEGVGISHELLEACDHTVTIPQFGNVESLNAAVAAGILFYESARQRMTQEGEVRGD